MSYSQAPQRAVCPITDACVRTREKRSRRQIEPNLSRYRSKRPPLNPNPHGVEPILRQGVRERQIILEPIVRAEHAGGCNDGIDRHYFPIVRERLSGSRPASPSTDATAAESPTPLGSRRQARSRIPHRPPQPPPSQREPGQLANQRERNTCHHQRTDEGDHGTESAPATEAQIDGAADQPRKQQPCTDLTPAAIGITSQPPLELPAACGRELLVGNQQGNPSRTTRRHQNRPKQACQISGLSNLDNAALTLGARSR